MKYLLSLVTLVAVTNAVVIPRQVIPCTFYMAAVGDPNGSIVETTIGENRIGGTYPQGLYSIDAKKLTDTEGHNCSISSTTAQFQCIQGSAVTLFTLGDNGNLLYNNTNANWLACPATGPGEDGSFNIFTQAKKNTTGCETIQIVTGGFSCAALGRPTSTSTSSIASATSTPTFSIIPLPATTSTTSVTASCPTDITSGPFQYPHLIVPISPESPTHAFGNQFTAHITPENSTLFNFDIPSSAPYTGTCALLFLLPVASATQAGTYNFTGIEEETEQNGGINFAVLDGIANVNTTWDSKPVVKSDLGTLQVLPGKGYTVAVFECPAGKTKSYSAESVGGLGLEYFENSASSAIGLFMVPCS
ncbi:hypothetical protein SBOR_8240 [Sclerotinia borealis F-4128]|uniref:Ubiquitin 3 binding protein But2 C-terminal domain-containing protein n=1 Tax=Sclerotinia borealis (strain F-4128) TaxID=1432307 RepID=W9C6P1_SCLBF|nr:hypothetical protein SBOR_8240 [Sclerotinia borealis F-4128]